MTQIQHVTAKEMTRRTGVNNALGYTYPKKDLILLKKGLKGKKKREVIDHELNHLRKGEEGPFWGNIAAAGIGLIGARKGRKSAESSAADQNALLREQTEQSREDLAPYREFGEKRIGELENWLAGPGGQFVAPTAEEVTLTPGYESRLGAVEGSAAARGSLFSGNTLRDIGEFGSQEYGTAYNRKLNEYQNELARRTGLAKFGAGAAGQTAGISESLGQRLSGVEAGRGRAKADYWGDVGSTVGGAIGQYEGEKKWNDFLNRFDTSSGGGDAAFDDTDWGELGW